MAKKKAKAKAKKSPVKKKKAPARKPAAVKKNAAAKKPAKKKAGGKRGSKKDLLEIPTEPHLPWREPLTGETFVGPVDDFFGHIGVIAMTLKAPLKAGDKIHVRGHTTEITQRVESMQIEHKTVPSARSGDGVGIRVNGKARRGDYVYRIG
jgi:putative protease